METEPDTIEEMKDDVEQHRQRLKEGWQDVRSSLDPRDRVEDAIRRNPMAAVTAAAVTGLVAGSAILPSSRQSPVGLLLGGMMGLAYRGFFMAATPVFAQRLADWAAPTPDQRRAPYPKHTDFPQDIARQPLVETTEKHAVSSADSA